VAPFQEIKNQKTHTIPQEKKIHAIHEKQGSNEDMNTQKVTNNSSQNVFPRTKSQVFPILGKGYTRIIAVGGCNEVGKNLTVIQYAEEFFIIGGGIGFPEDTDFGAKYSIPDITPLFAIKKKIVGIIVMNGHLGQIG
jgi:predicted metal-dependent RNase